MTRENGEREREKVENPGVSGQESVRPWSLGTQTCSLHEGKA